MPFTSVWEIPSDMGRRYGSVSGDRNPIHLYALTAKPLGFSTAIAHGMWTAAKAVAGLEGRLPASYVYEVAFRQPVQLPSKVHYVSDQVKDEWRLGLRSPRDGRVHLQGRVAPIS